MEDNADAVVNRFELLTCGRIHDLISVLPRSFLPLVPDSELSKIDLAKVSNAVLNRLFDMNMSHNENLRRFELLTEADLNY